MQLRTSLISKQHHAALSKSVARPPGFAGVRQAGHSVKQHAAAVLLLKMNTVANPWLQRGSCCWNSCLGAAAGSAAVPNSPQQQQIQLPHCQPHDILRAVTSDGEELYLEVIAPSAQTSPAADTSTDSSSASQQAHQVQLAHQGVVYVVNPNPSQNPSYLQLQPRRWQLHLDHPLVKALPGWTKALQVQQSKQQLPQQPLQLQSAEVVYSAAQLQAAVKQNPALWRDGTGPLDPPLKGLQYQTLCAGEIECLLNHSRGVTMVQLSVGWDVTAPQPISNPLVLHGLERALATKHISIFMSSAAGGLGLTAILSAKAEPFRSWAAHLASFGAQAALVADSPYYKLLIGRILGYKEENIRYHIQSTSGRQHPSSEVVAAVDKDLAKLSRKKPELPWRPDAAANNIRGKQQQARSAKSRR